MDSSQFDALVSRLSAHLTRRRSLGVLATLGAGAGLADAASLDARKKKHKKHKKRGGKTTPPPPPTGPVALADASCLATGSGTIGPRLAQTFRARRSGSLTSATVFLRKTEPGIAVDVEIWSVDGSNAPTLPRLAGVTLTNVPVVSGGPSQPLTATFPGPATVVAGMRYALVVTEPSSSSFGLESSNPGPCPDGGAFYSFSPTGMLVESGGDLRFETVVTA